MDSANVMSKTREFVGQYLNNTEVDPETDLFATRMVNSLFAMQLVLFVEKEFGLQVQNEDLDYENFKSLNAISGFIGRKLGL